MEILQIILAKYIMVYLLQSIICVLAVCAICKKKIEIKLFSLVTIIFFASAIIIRLLPIEFGVHTLFILIVLIILGITLLKTPIYKTVLSVLIVGVIILLTEILNGVFLGLVIGFENITEFSKNELNWSIAGIPANILFLFAVLFIYKLNTKPDNKENNNGEISS